MKRVQKLKITKIPVTETYELVDWPDSSSLVPSFFQIESTLAIIEMYKDNPKQFKGPLKLKIEAWFRTNAASKFEAASMKAATEQERLDNIKQSTIDDNCEYSSRRWRRQDH